MKKSNKIIFASLFSAASLCVIACNKDKEAVTPGSTQVSKNESASGAFESNLISVEANLNRSLGDLKAKGDTMYMDTLYYAVPAHNDGSVDLAENVKWLENHIDAAIKITAKRPLSRVLALDVQNPSSSLAYGNLTENILTIVYSVAPKQATPLTPNEGLCEFTNDRRYDGAAIKLQSVFENCYPIYDYSYYSEFETKVFTAKLDLRTGKYPFNESWYVKDELYNKEYSDVSQAYISASGISDYNGKIYNMFDENRPKTIDKLRTKVFEIQTATVTPGNKIGVNLRKLSGTVYKTFFWKASVLYYNVLPSYLPPLPTGPGGTH